MEKFTTLKEQNEQRRLLLEAISDTDLSKLDATFEKLDDLIGDINLPTLQAAIEKAREQIGKAAAKPGPEIPDVLAGGTIAQLVLLQSMLVSLFQSLPKIMRVVKGNLPNIVTTTTGVGKQVEESRVMKLRSASRILLEKDFDASELGGGGDDLELDDGTATAERDEVINLITMTKRMHQQAKDQGVEGVPDSVRAFANKFIKPAMEDLGIEMQPGGGRGKYTEEEVNQILDSVMSTERPGSGRERKTSEAGVERADVAKVPLWSLLRQQGKNGESAIQNAQNLIAQAFRPKGFLNKMKSALRGGALPFGIDAQSMAKDILSLPLQNFLQLVDRSRRMGEMELSKEKAEEIAKEAEETADGGNKEAEIGRAKAGGKKMSVSRLQKALRTSSMPRQQQDAVVKFFNSALVGKGPVEFIE